MNRKLKEYDELKIELENLKKTKLNIYINQKQKLEISKEDCFGITQRQMARSFYR